MMERKEKEMKMCFFFPQWRLVLIIFGFGFLGLPCWVGPLYKMKRRSNFCCECVNDRVLLYIE